MLINLLHQIILPAVFKLNLLPTLKYGQKNNLTYYLLDVGEAQGLCFYLLITVKECNRNKKVIL